MTGETRACQISTTHMAERGSILFDCALQTPCQILSPNVIACDQPDKVWLKMEKFNTPGIYLHIN